MTAVVEEQDAFATDILQSRDSGLPSLVGCVRKSGICFVGIVSTSISRSRFDLLRNLYVVGISGVIFARHEGNDKART